MSEAFLNPKIFSCIVCLAFLKVELNVSKKALMTAVLTRLRSHAFCRWLHKPIDSAVELRGHDDHVITCLQFYGNRILSGSDDTTLKVWSAATGKVSFTTNLLR